MYLGAPKLSRLPNFIVGYQLGFSMAKPDDMLMDPYFGRGGFLDWYFTQYPERLSSFWTDSFLEEAQDDDELALNLFFDYLERYCQQREAP